MLELAMAEYVERLISSGLTAPIVIVILMVCFGVFQHLRRKKY